MFETKDALPNWFDGSINDQGTMDIYSVDETRGGFVAFDLFIKVKSATTVKFGSSSVSCDGNAELPTAMRIALVNCGTVKENAEASAIKSVLPPNTNARKVVYEVDASNHTVAAQALGANGIMETKPIISAGLGIKCRTDYPNTVALNTYSLFANLATTASVAKINVAAGITRMRVYMWMEGNDVDCANDVAGSTINFNLVLEID